MASTTSSHEIYSPSSHCTKKHLPWLSNFMTEDSDNLAFRRFDELFILHILSVQNQLIECSESLSLLRQSGKYEDLTNISEKLRVLLPEYESALSAYKRMRELHATPTYVKDVLKAKADQRVEPALALEYDRENGWADLISLSGGSKGPIHSFIDSKLELQRLFRQGKQDSGKKDLESQPGAYHRLSSQSGFFYYSESAAKLVEEIIIHIVVFCVLITPILTLPFAHTRSSKIGLIIGCVVLAFLASLLLLEHSPMLNFKLMLGYGALLVAFLSTGNGT